MSKVKFLSLAILSINGKQRNLKMLSLYEIRFLHFVLSEKLEILLNEMEELRA